MLLLSPFSSSSWLNLQYNAVIFFCLHFIFLLKICKQTFMTSILYHTMTTLSSLFALFWEKIFSMMFLNIQFSRYVWVPKKVPLIYIRHSKVAKCKQNRNFVGTHKLTYSFLYLLTRVFKRTRLFLILHVTDWQLQPCLLLISVYVVAFSLKKYSWISIYPTKSFFLSPLMHDKVRCRTFLFPFPLATYDKQQEKA